MKLSPAGVVSALALCLAAAPAAQASRICAVAAADGSGCHIDAPGILPFTVYIVATLYDDAAAAGISTAEFRLTGVSDQPATVTPTPAANVYVGNPLQCGVIIGFPSCQTGSGSPPSVLLYTLNIMPIAAIGPRVLRVARYCFDQSIIRCAKLQLCDPPNFTRVCVPDCESCLNDDPCPECVLAVEPATWTGVKSMYQR